jgi:tetratricopeptide (TPR) repeat protein
MNAAALAGTVLVSGLAAFGAQRLARRDAPAPANSEHEAEELARIAASVQELRLANESLANELEARTLAPAVVAPSDEEFGEADIAAGLARWRAEHPEEVARLVAAQTTPTVPPSPDDLDIATIPIEELVQVLSRSSFGQRQRQELFQKVRDAGRIDEYLAAIEKLAAGSPNDPDLQVALGHAYLQKLFGVGNTPEAGPLAFKSDAAFDRALELDDHNWGARFSKAVSLSNWPDFMGRGPEAIENFEILLEQQATQAKRPEFAMTYLYLGNMLEAGGKHEQALATWRAGLELFPDHEELRRALAAQR